MLAFNVPNNQSEKKEQKMSDMFKTSSQMFGDSTTV